MKWSQALKKFLKKLKNPKRGNFQRDIATKALGTKLQRKNGESPSTRRTVKIDIRPLKTLVLEKFPKSSPLRMALLAERDVLEAEEFLAKLETWLILLKGSG